MSAVFGTALSSTDDTALLTVPEVVGKRIRIHSVSGGFIPAPQATEERNLSIVIGGVTTATRFPIFTSHHFPFPVEVVAPEGDGAGAGTVTVQLGAGGTGVTGYINMTYTVR